MIVNITAIDLSGLLKDEIIALIAYLILYLTYYFASNFGFVRKFRLRFNETETDFEPSVYLRRSIGFVLLGVIPFSIALFFFDRPIVDYGIGLPKGQYWLLWFLIPTVVITVGNLLRSNKKIDIAYYPEVRKQSWDRQRTLTNAGFWAVYLLGYEFAIRGFLFFSLLYAFGLWPAVIINSVIYSLIHIFKGSGEAFGAFFLGILLCLITYYTNTFWIAFIIHVIMAVINDIKAVNAAKTKTYVN